MRRKHIIPFLILIVLGFWGIRQVFGGTFYSSHDGYTHVARIFQYDKAFSDGQFPPRWAGTLNNGAGSPIFVFSYPLPYIMGTLLHMGGFDYTEAFQILVAGSLVVSAIAFFLFLNELFDVVPSLVGGLFYMIAPYRFLNIYVRGSLSESVGYLLVPLVFLTLVRLIKQRTPQRFMLFSMSISLLLLSQYLVAVLFLPIIASFVLVLFFQTKKREILYDFGLAMIFGFGIASFSYFPVVFERSHLRFTELMSYYQNHFVHFYQLVRSPWGYGFSLPGTGDAMSFQIGLAHIAVVLLSLVLVFIFYFKKWKIPRYVRELLCIGYIFFAISIVLMIDTTFTKWLWQTVPVLTIIDIPWRFLGITVFSASLIGVCAAALLTQLRGGIFIIFALCVLLVYANRNHIRVNQYIEYSDSEFIQYRGNATWINEYTPIWRNETTIPELKTRFSISDAQTQVRELVSDSNDYELQVESTAGGILRLNILYFPGWEIAVDGAKKQIGGKEVFITKGNELVDESYDASGFIGVEIDSGTHTVAAHFGETPIRRVGDLVSILSLVALPMAAYTIVRKTRS